ncbi:MAG: hypothetical protein LUC24_03920 [Bacteroidales bacterium]|nr:hypothetical protein [Bacteroidales bacterium]
MKRIVLLLLAAVAFSVGGMAQENASRLSLGFGGMYRNGLDLTLSYERVGEYHNAWEFFANGYLKWAECPSCGHVCPESFWRNYDSYVFGVAYKPCVVVGRNSYGCVRVGASAGGDTSRFIVGIHLGYEHNYVLRGGWCLFWQVKVDCMIRAKDLFRPGVAFGFKVPLN